MQLSISTLKEYLEDMDLYLREIEATLEQLGKSTEAAHREELTLRLFQLQHQLEQIASGIGCGAANIF
jgi:hypothetical protein